ncbi:hypothetical protein GIY62_00145 [Burkholderia plantarii]|uniref:hypothetical protein n=1 Tax=Burkholderia plantarii TaxID=41899 RepID=UPI00272A9B2A|nr:hypothetical protein [Burkholderia plantarii]WLE59163.1 hypothetical protein GIY62_00145 [Burkholderia plantarii]
MAKNDFKAFATGDDANVLSQADYDALAARSSGFQSGIAKSAQLNKVLRQSSIIAAVLAQFIVDQVGKDATDNGSVDALVENLKAAIFNDTALTGAPTAPTPDVEDDSTRLATTAFVQQLSGNSATQQWVRDNAVVKTGDTMTGTLNAPNLSVNQGVEDDTSATLIYNDQGRRNIVFRTGPAGEYKYSFINEDGVMNLPARPMWTFTPWDTGNFDPNSLISKGGGTMTGTLYVPVVRLNEGLIDDGAVPEIYNDTGKRNLVFRTGPESAYKYSVFDENGLLTLPARPQWGATPWDTGNFDPLSLVAKAGDVMSGDLCIQRTNDNARGILLRRPDGTNQFWIHGTKDYMAIGLMAGNGEWSANPFSMATDGTVTVTKNMHIGGATYFSDGNIWGSTWGNDYLSNVVSNKANAGSQCQRVDLREFGPVGFGQVVDLPAPWVMCGLRLAFVSGYDVFYPRGTWLRNQ